MTWEQVQKEWERWKPAVQEQWAELRDGDLNFIAGHRQRLAIALCRRYGISLEQAHKRIDWWLEVRAPQAGQPPRLADR